MLTDHYRRPKPTMQVELGYSPEKAMDRRIWAPVHASHTDIQSGMLISQDSAGKWVKGWDPATQVNPCFAETDALDPDVIAARTLAGLSCSGEFTLLTGFFKDVAYAPGDRIVPDADTPGYVKVADANGQRVIATVGTPATRDLGGGAHLTDPAVLRRASNLGVSASAFAGSQLGTEENSEAISSAMVRLETNYSPSGAVTAGF